MTNPFTGITLAVPHSSGKPPLEEVCTWAKDSVVLKERDRRTDWFTEDLFVCQMEDVKNAVTRVSRLDCDVECDEDAPDRLCGHRFVDGKKPTAKEQNDNLIAWYGYRFMVMNNAAFSGDRPLIIDCHSFPSDLAPDVDVCIGVNDINRPSEEAIAVIAAFFEKAGYRTRVDQSFGGPIALKGYVGESVKIEVNKRCYMDEATIEKSDGFEKLRRTLKNLYRVLLGREEINPYVRATDFDPEEMLAIARAALPKSRAVKSKGGWAKTVAEAPEGAKDYYANEFAFDAVKAYLAERCLEDDTTDLYEEIRQRVLERMNDASWDYVLSHMSGMSAMGLAHERREIAAAKKERGCGE